MKKVIASLVAVAGMSAAAHAQLMQMLVSTDGVNFSSAVTANPGSTVQCLVTVSYTGTLTAVAGFGSAIFQPTVSNWHGAAGGDTLLPLRQGGNQLPADGSGMIEPQFYTNLGVTAGGSAVSYGHIGGNATQNPGGQYVPGTYGRVLPMGRAFLSGTTAIQGFYHVNPNGDGVNYLRIAQAVVTDWIGVGGNTNGLSGVNVGQLYVTGRTTSDPDFWGNNDTLFDPALGWSNSGRIAADDARRANVEVFRFAMTLDSTTAARTLTVDAPLAGQQLDSNNVRYMGFYTNASQSTAGLHSAVVVQDGTISIVPTPASLALLGLGGLAVGRRRR
jgi:uncharacterized protein (TIGR03382 family)